MVDLLQNSFSRLWSMDGRARPDTSPAYQSLWSAGAFNWPQGDNTRIRIPSPDVYGQFVTKGKVSGEQGAPELTLMGRYNTNVSELLKLARRRCDFDVQLHFGICKDPRNFNLGWNKILVVEAVRVTNYSTTDLGAMDDASQAVVNEEVPVSGEDAYEILPISFASKAGNEVVREVIDVIVCDAQSCAECGVPSDGCNVVFAVVKSSDASPGIPSELVFTDDGGDTWSDTDITTLGMTEDPSALACVGPYVIVISAESVSLHYAPIVDILQGVESWAEVTTGFNAGGAPHAIFSPSSSHVWIVGAGGYIYFTNDPTSEVAVQDAGSATVQQLNAIHGIDLENVVAVGNSNAVVRTTNGGETWESITGPAVGVNLNTVFMVDERVWFVGTASGRLFYTVDGGLNWSEKGFPGSGSGAVQNVVFTTPTVGYMAHSTGTAGRVLRSVDGGYSWYVAPEGSTSIPANDRINKIAACDNVNTLFAGGLGDNAVDGILIKGAGVGE